MFNQDSKVIAAYAEVVRERKRSLLHAILDCLDTDDDSVESLQELDEYLTDYVLLDLAYIKLIDIHTGAD
jgi:hypothetical protein